MQENEVGILQELDIQRQHFRAIYAQAPHFCQQARAGHVVSTHLVRTPDDIERWGASVQSTCGCYYGTVSVYQEELAAHWVDNMRIAYHAQHARDDKDIDITPIEQLLIECSHLEGKHYQNDNAPYWPIPWENPILQLFVALIERHLAQ
jgi:hypothetical protein